MAPHDGNIFRVTGPLCGEFTGHRRIPLTKASDAELWFFVFAPNKRLSKQSWGWWFETWSRSLWCHGNGHNGPAKMWLCSWPTCWGSFSKSMCRCDHKSSATIPAHHGLFCLSNVKYSLGRFTVSFMCSKSSQCSSVFVIVLNIT